VDVTILPEKEPRPAGRPHRRPHQQEDGLRIGKIILEHYEIVIVKIQAAARVAAKETNRAKIFLMRTSAPPRQFLTQHPPVPIGQHIRRTAPVLRLHRIEPLNPDYRLLIG
jgi:hypothetical protein